jgi:uncharacterized membrane protein
MAADDYDATRHSDREEHTVALIAYVLHLVGTVTALPSVIGLVVNYVKRHDGPAEIASHHAYMIRTFWWTLLWMIVGWLLTIVLVGFAILALAWLWYIYRHVRGLIRLLDHRPMPV